MSKKQGLILQKVEVLLKEVPGLERLVDRLRFDYLISDFQVKSMREIILSEFPKQIELCEKAIKRLKSQQIKIFDFSKIPKKTIIIIFIIIIGVLLFIFIPRPPPVLEIKITPGSSLYSFQWSEGQWKGNPVNYTIEVTNNGNEDFQDVSVTDSVGFDWTGTLKAGETKSFVIIYMGELKDNLAISARVQGTNSEGVLFSNSVETTIDIFGGIYDLQFATEEGLIVWELKSKGACSGYSIDFSAKLKVNLFINITLDTPMILLNSDTGQNMIICDKRTLNLVPKVDYDFEIKAYCLDLHKGNPSSSEILQYWMIRKSMVRMWLPSLIILIQWMLK